MQRSPHLKGGETKNRNRGKEGDGCLVITVRLEPFCEDANEKVKRPLELGTTMSLGGGRSTKLVGGPKRALKKKKKKKIHSVYGLRQKTTDHGERESWNETGLTKKPIMVRPLR